MFPNNSWFQVLKSEFEGEYFKNLESFVDEVYEKETIFPPKNQIFNAFDLCDFHNLKVVIIGQDPYHGFGEANGLAFSVNDNVKIPPSLRNIFQKLKDEFGKVPDTSDLSFWAQQGVLLLNAALTVKENKANSHANEWKQFTDAVIKIIAEKHEKLVFILWGKFAQSKQELINQKNHHLILSSSHPSPFSARIDFFKKDNFTACNNFLIQNSKEAIRWV